MGTLVSMVTILPNIQKQKKKKTNVPHSQQKEEMQTQQK